MDIAGVSMALANVKATNEIGTAVLSKALNTNEQMGQSLVNMIDRAGMERSVNPSVGGNIDLYA